MPDTRPLLAFVGGFLGAGKTTLILKTAELLEKRGKRAAIIVNDQDSELVDTKLGRARGFKTGEVIGGCFCCRFSGLIDAAEDLLAYEPDVILAEPVGSCIDLAATILRPLQSLHDEIYRVAPLTVLLDPGMADRLRGEEVAPAIRYLVTRQLAEADLICLSKRDLEIRSPDVPFPIDFQLSAQTGEGVDEWLDEILATTRVVGAGLLEVDYEEYGAAEAALGWVNAHIQVQLSEATSPAAVCGPLMDRLESALSLDAISIAHLKVFDRALTGWVKASVSAGQRPIPTGDLLADAAPEHEIAINLRAMADPAALREAVSSALAEIPGRVQIHHLSAFRPAAPVPQHRMPLHKQQSK